MSKRVHVFSQYIDFLQKHHVFFHNPCVFLFMDILILLEHLSQIVDAVFEILSSISILSVDVCISCFILEFLFHIFLVKTNNAFPEAFMVMQAMH